MARWQILRPHVEDGVALTRLAADHRVPLRTLQRWLSGYRAGGLARLAPADRPERRVWKVPPDLLALIEGLALRRPAPTIAAVHRQAAEVAGRQGWPAPSYGTVYAAVRDLDPALATLAYQPERYRRRSSWCTGAKPARRTRSGRPTIPSWICGSSARPGGLPGPG